MQPANDLAAILAQPLTIAEQRANLTAAITEAHALAALDAPEYWRRTAAGRRWRDARPWLSDAWTIWACGEELAALGDDDPHAARLARLHVAIDACGMVLACAPPTRGAE